MNQSIKDFSEFSETFVGSTLISEQLDIFDKYSSKCIGYNLLQLSLQHKKQLIQNDRVGHYINMSYFKDDDILLGDLQTDYQNFPISTDSIDNLILHHILEFTDNPYQILRESDRILSDGGNLIIMSFNPMSMLPFVSVSSRILRKPFIRPKYIRLGRVIDWLTVLNYEILVKKLFFYKLPFNNNWIFNNSTWLESLGQSIKLPTGLCYLLIAKKRSFPLNPIHKHWASIVKSTKKRSVSTQQKHI